MRWVLVARLEMDRVVSVKPPNAAPPVKHNAKWLLLSVPLRLSPSLAVCINVFLPSVIIILPNILPNDNNFNIHYKQTRPAVRFLTPANSLSFNLWTPGEIESVMGVYSNNSKLSVYFQRLV